MPTGSTVCRAAAAGVLIVSLAACGARPYPVAAPKSLVKEVRRQSEGEARNEAPTPTIVSICYSGVANSPEEVLEEARLACPDGEVALHQRDIWWTPCGLLQPIRASFVCTPKPQAAQ